MKKLALAAAGALTLVAGAASAAPAQVVFGVDHPGDAALVQSQYFYAGRNFCWYDSAWRGPGFYWCGYAWRHGYGWGGPVGWRGWNGPGYWRHGAWIGPRGYAHPEWRGWHRGGWHHGWR